MAAFLHAADGNGLALIDVGLDMLLDAIIAEGMITVKSLHILRAYGLVADLASYHPAVIIVKDSLSEYMFAVDFGDELRALDFVRPVHIKFVDELAAATEVDIGYLSRFSTFFNPFFLLLLVVVKRDR